MQLVAFTLIALLAAGSLSSASGSGCSDSDALTGNCPSVTGTITGDEAVLDGTLGGGSGSGGGGGGGGGTATTTPDPCVATATCRSEFTVTTLPTPALSDLIGFRPTPAVDHMEPNGWFVVGLDSNFYATGGSSVQAGPLLGYPAQVRFTPIRWSWTYGDGHSATRTTAGSTWSAQRIPEFDPTATSHIYVEPGTYFIDLSVGYRAEYNFAGAGWQPISGVLWLPANRLVATVGSAKTVLVERDCTNARTGPGC